MVGEAKALGYILISVV